MPRLPLSHALLTLVLLMPMMRAGAQARVDRLPEAALPAASVDIMLVGVLHFAQQDTMRFDVLHAARQREVEAAVARLARFRPTKVMVEWQPYFAQRVLDSTYAAYRADRFTLPRNEIHQLGFRLARVAGLPRVWAVDHAGFWLGDSLRRIASATGQLALLDGDAAFTHPSPDALVSRDSLLARATVTGILDWLNSPGYQALMYDGYVNRMARVGITPDDDFDERTNGIGGQHVAEWVRRNIKIYRTILSRTDYEARDRLIVFIGADHIAPLRHFFESNLNFRVVDVHEVLARP